MNNLHYIFKNKMDDTVTCKMEVIREIIYMLFGEYQDLEQELDQANKKLDKIKEFVNKSIRPEYRNGNSNEFYLEMNEKELKNFLSIIGGNNE